jgi:outer membrane protein assembly factor BamB
MKPLPRGRTPLVVSALLAVAMLAACGKNKSIEPPAELTEFRSTAQVTRAWSTSVDGEPKLRLGLGVALVGETVFAAGHNGAVAAYDVQSGSRAWQVNTKLPLTGGPGAGPGLVVVGASHGDIVALDAATGATRWKTRINSEILAAPTVGSEMILLRTVDGRLAALHAADGSLAWSAEQQVPRLSLRGTSEPAISGEMAVSGFDNGRLMALSLADGSTMWEVTVAPPSGRTELERLVDIDAAVKVVDTDIYAVTFQGKVARIDRDTGQVQWSRDTSSFSGLATDEDGLYVSSSEGVVLKIGRRTGVELWKQEVLAHRRLSPPVVVGSLVAVADLQGYVHFLDASNGALAARVKSGGKHVSAPLLVHGDTVILMDDAGRITALRVTPPKS